MERWMNDIKENIKTAFGVCFLGGCLLGASPSNLSAEETASVSAKPSVKVLTKDWKKVESKEGKCIVEFPGVPEHVSEIMKIDDEGTELKYDAYIASAGPESVFMLLVALYPEEFLDEELSHKSLESFLNGILSHGSGSQLIFADLVLVDGHQGLDFFIRSGANYFKGRALLSENLLYLMAMECKVSEYDEKHYDRFVNSFLLNK